MQLTQEQNPFKKKYQYFKKYWAPTGYVVREGPEVSARFIEMNTATAAVTHLTSGNGRLWRMFVVLTQVSE